jgi:hypothetical protein
VALFAEHLGGVSAHNCVAYAHVFAVRHCPEMFRVHATPVAAQVVDFTALGDFAFVEAKGNAMRLFWPRAVPQTAVPGRLFRPGPLPAIGDVFYFGE